MSHFIPSVVINYFTYSPYTGCSSSNQEEVISAEMTDMKVNQKESGYRGKRKNLAYSHSLNFASERISNKLKWERRIDGSCEQTHNV